MLFIIFGYGFSAIRLSTAFDKIIKFHYSVETWYLLMLSVRG